MNTTTHKSMLITGTFCVAMFVGLLGHAEVVVEVGSTYADAGAKANSAKDGDITAKVVTSNTVDTSKLGTYTVTYNVTDSLGLAAAPVVRTVRVADRTKPVITLKGTASVTIRRGATYVDAGATATDNYDGIISSKIVVTGTVNTAKAGTYRKNFNVKDSSGNVATTVTRTVVVAAVAAKSVQADLKITSPVTGSHLYVPSPDARVLLTMKASTLADVEDVTFTLDGVPFGIASASPYATTTELDVAKFGLGEHHLVAVANAKAGNEELSDETVFTVSVADTQNDSDGDGLPDQPFVTLAGNGDTWIHNGISMIHFANDGQTEDTTVMLEGTEDKSNTVKVDVPNDLIGTSEDALLVVELQENTSDAPNATVQILTSIDGGNTVVSVDDAQVAAHPIQVLLQDGGSTWKADLTALTSAEK